MALPVPLRQFLPTLDENAILPSCPTIDRGLQATMFSGKDHLADDIVRYQLQTWRNRRRPESRLTDGFRPIHKIAKAGDILIFQRRANAVDYYRLILIKMATREYAEIGASVNGRRCGVLFLNHLPVCQAQLTQGTAEVEQLAQSAFVTQMLQIKRSVKTHKSIVRSTVFRERVRQEYNNKCAISGNILVTPRQSYEVESAHVVPVSDRGSDDIRNGIALMQSLHWAFDEGLIGVKPDRTTYIPRQVMQGAGNDFLKQFDGTPITEATTAGMRVHPDAFLWHYNNRVRRWD